MIWIGIAQFLTFIAGLFFIIGAFFYFMDWLANKEYKNTNSIRDKIIKDFQRPF